MALNQIINEIRLNSGRWAGTGSRRSIDWQRWQTLWLRIEITAGRWLIIIDGPASIADRNKSKKEQKSWRIEFHIPGEPTESLSKHKLMGCPSHLTVLIAQLNRSILIFKYLKVYAKNINNLMKLLGCPSNYFISKISLHIPNHQSKALYHHSTQFHKVDPNPFVNKSGKYNFNILPPQNFDVYKAIPCFVFIKILC